MGRCAVLTLALIPVVAFVALKVIQAPTATEDVSAQIGESSMRAAQYASHGQAAVDVLRVAADVAIPKLSCGDVLIQVHAAALNPVDFKFMQGGLAWAYSILGISLPRTPGFDVAGTVAALGSCVPPSSQLTVGLRVYAMNDFRLCGALAEYMRVPYDRVAPLPASLNFSQAAALPLAGLTSYEALISRTGTQRGERVLVLGGAGGTGTLAIQIAKHIGAYVAATASPRGEGLVKSMGADVVYNYKTAWVEQVLQEKKHSALFDVVYDCVGGTESWQIAQRVLQPGRGRFVSIVGDQPSLKPWGMLKKGATILSRSISGLVGWGPSYHLFTCFGSGWMLRELTNMVDARAVWPVIDSVFPLERAAEAMAHLQAGHAKGKVVVCVRDC